MGFPILRRAHMAVSRLFQCPNKTWDNNIDAGRHILARRKLWYQQDRFTMRSSTIFKPFQNMIVERKLINRFIIAGCPRLENLRL